MNENVSVEMFKIWSSSQNTLLKNLHQEIKSIALEQKDTKKGKQYYLGVFDDPEVAAQVVRIERLKLHGEFANHG